MASEVGSLCPELSVAEDEGDLGLSTFNRSIGAVVRFFCPQDGYFLFGPEAVECQYTTRWNDSIPKCLPTSVPPASLLPTSRTQQTSTEWTPATNSAETAVETVVIILWAAGGALLFALIVLLGCIFRSHNKHRTRNQPNGNPPHGGINQGYTSYDEIWTWIPVVTDTQATCTPPRTTSARENSSSRNTETVATLTPPSYSDVMRESANTVHLSRPRDLRTETRVTTNNNNNNHSSSNNNNSRQFTPIRAPVNAIVNEYDTIPADIQRPVAIRSSVRPYVSHAVVTSNNQLQVHSRPGETTLSALTRVLQSPRPGRSNATSRQNNRARGGNSNMQTLAEASNASQLRHCALNFFPPQHTSTQRRQFAL